MVGFEGELGRKILIGALVLVSACGGGRGTPSGRERDGGAGPTPNDGGYLDPSGTFETAQKLHVGDFPGVFGTILGPDDVHFFSFDGSAGEWVSIQSNDTGALSVADTPLTVYGSDRQPFASNEYVDTLKGENVLARVVMRLPVAGTYYVKVANGSAPPFDSGFVQSYQLSVVDVAGADGYVVGDGPTDATPVRFLVRSIPGTDAVKDAFLLGAFSSAGDVRTFSFDVAAGTAKLLDAEVAAGTAAGNGSTSTAGKIWVTDAADSTIGEIDNSTGQTMLTPPLPAGSYVLHVAHPGAPLGSNDFFAIRALVADDSPESMETSNETVATAQPLANDPDETTGELAYLTAYVGEGAVEYFRFDGVGGQTASVHCTAAEQGSGIVGLPAAVDASDTTLDEGTETATAPVSLTATIPATGSLYVKVAKASQLVDVAGDWLRCVLSAS